MVVDLELRDIPKEFDERQLKQVVGKAQVVKSRLEVDRVNNQCKGKGEVQLKLLNGKDLSRVQLQLMKYGISGKLKEERQKSQRFSEQMEKREKSSL